VQPGAEFKERPALLPPSAADANAPKAAPRSSRVADLVLAATFLALVTLPLLDQLFHVDPTPRLAEQRPPTPPPRLPHSRRDLARLPSACDAWYADAFGFRNTLVRAHAAALYFGFGISPTKRVVVGTNGWAFFEDETDYLQAPPLALDELEQWRRVLERRNDWLASRHCRYLFVIAPNKSTIHSERLPSSVRRGAGPTRLDQLVDHLRARSHVPVLDLRQALAAAKAASAEPLYYRTDTHWNAHGAWIGYLEIAKTLHSWFPAVEALPETAYRLEASEPRGLDLSVMMGLDELVREPLLYPLPVSHFLAIREQLTLPKGLVVPPEADSTFVSVVADTHLPRMVLFRDSFADALVALLGEHSSRFVSYRGVPASSVNSVFEPALVEQERPDVVISEMCERLLASPPPRMLDLPLAPGR
jgi:alginate O-acetyltransferase complex protein AlgJ